MKIISHRGNLNGPTSKLENTREHLWEAIKAGFDIEVDVWYLDGWYFGHDENHLLPVSVHALHGLDPWAWYHAKNVEALYYLRKIGATRFFFHQTDDVTITSDGHFWTFAGKPITNRSIACLPENAPNWDVSQAFGVCTDYPSKYI